MFDEVSVPSSSEQALPRQKTAQTPLVGGHGPPVWPIRERTASHFVRSERKEEKIKKRKTNVTLERHQKAVSLTAKVGSPHNQGMHLEWEF